MAVLRVCGHGTGLVISFKLNFILIRVFFSLLAIFPSSRYIRKWHKRYHLHFRSIFFCALFSILYRYSWLESDKRTCCFCVFFVCCLARFRLSFHFVSICCVRCVHCYGSNRMRSSRDVIETVWLMLKLNSNLNCRWRAFAVARWKAFR